MSGHFVEKPETGGRVAWLVLAALAVLCALAWSNALTGDFLFDDRFSITENERVRTFDLGRIVRENPTRALPEISFAANWALSLSFTWSYHLTNLVLHIATAWAVWWLATLVFASREGSRAGPAVALIVAVAFALHPVQTQAVTYISQRAAVMAALFYVLSVACYLRFRLRGRGAFFAVALVCAVAAALSKPNAASLPVAILLVELLLVSDTRRWWRRVAWVAPFALTPLLIAALTFATGVRSAGALASVGAGVTGLPSPGAYALSQIDVVRTYWRLLVFPFGLNLDYDYPMAARLFAWPTAASLGLHVAILVGAVVLIVRRRRIEAFGILWFYVALSVESSVVPLSDLIMEHRMYLALFGPLVALGAWLGPVLLERRLRFVLVVAAVALLALTWQRNLVWRDGVALWTDTARKSPGKKRPVYNAANALYDARRYREAEPWYLAALALEPEGTAVPESEGLPVRPVALRELGHLYVHTGQTTKALATLPRAIAWHPDDAGLHTNLAIAHIRAGQFAEAVAPARRALALEPDSAQSHVNLGMVLLRAGDLAGARATLEQALKMAPKAARAMIYLSEVEEASGNAARARELLTQSIDLAKSQRAPEAVIRELEQRRARLINP